MAAAPAPHHRHSLAGRLGLLHGFTQTGRSWDPLRPHFEPRFEVVAPDLPGHGSRSAVRAGLWEAAELVAEDCGRAAYLGYSMGGRVALHLALARPDLVERLVVVSASAGIEDDEDRAARRAADEELARSLEAEGVERFLDRWLAQPLFSRLPREAAGLDARRQNTAEGLASSLRLMGTGVQEPLWRRLGDLGVPVLLVAGEHDDAYLELSMRMAAWVGAHASLVMVPDAGHACHLERPEAFAELVLPFLEEHEHHSAAPGGDGSGGGDARRQ